MARPRRPKLHPRLREHRENANLTQEALAEKIGITAEMVRRHEQGLQQPIEQYRLRYSQVFRTSPENLGLVPTVAGRTGAQLLGESPTGVLRSESVDHVLSEITDSAATSGSIDRLTEATHDLAELHVDTPARDLLAQVLTLRSTVHEVIRRRVKLSQMRELYRIEGDLLAHSCLLLGDVGQGAAAQVHGMAALAFAQEAGTNESIARTALAKTLRWEERLIESANMARAGYQSSPATPIRVQLASQEANAAALLGDVSRANEALARADRDAEECTSDSGRSAWSFPTGRRAIFALSMATQAGDPIGALRAADLADEGWRKGEPASPVNWAQIRIGAAIAHLDTGELERSLAEALPALKLDPHLRVATVASYATNLAKRIDSIPTLRTNSLATELRDRIRAFMRAALPPRPTDSQ